MSLNVADRAGQDIGLANVAVATLSVELERSGLVNAQIVLTADAAPGPDGPFVASAPLRLADTSGSFEHGDLSATLVDAAIVIEPSGAASGRVSLRLPDPHVVTGPGKLSFGWHEGGQMLAFAGEATLSPPIDAFDDGDAVQANYTWRGDAFHAIVISDRADPLAKTDI